MSAIFLRALSGCGARILGDVTKKALIGALTLYLDFINLFAPHRSTAGPVIE
jgi:FtsH-binding integral membrane protein